MSANSHCVWGTSGAGTVMPVRRHAQRRQTSAMMVARRRLMTSSAAGGRSPVPGPDLASPVQRVAVLGLGTIGHSMAQVFAQGGCEVQCFSPSPATRDSLHTRVRGNLAKMAAADLIPGDRGHASSIVDRLAVYETEDEALQGADFVWEASPEVLEMKQDLMRRVEESVSDHTIIVSTTSTFPMTDMAAGMRLPSRAIGE